MSFDDLNSTVPSVVLGAAACVIGALGGSRLVVAGLAQLNAAATSRQRLVARAICGLAGLAAAVAIHHAGSWLLLPALLIWAYGLTAAATCDGFTQRVPTLLIRRTGLVTAVLTVCAVIVSGNWQWAAFAVCDATAAALVFGACWRFVGMGFGDVRIAMLGGLGTVAPTHAGLFVGILTFTVITLVQARTARAGNGSLHSTIPYGPAIATAFLVIAMI